MSALDKPPPPECGRLLWTAPYRDCDFFRFYKGIVPLWSRQIPYTMMKFACFERTVEALYKFVVPKPRSECSKSEQLVVTFVAGYIAGVFCAVVSHPADSVVSLLNKDKGSTALEALKKLGPKGWLTAFVCVCVCVCVCVYSITFCNMSHFSIQNLLYHQKSVKTVLHSK